MIETPAGYEKLVAHCGGTLDELWPALTPDEQADVRRCAQSWRVFLLELEATPDNDFCDEYAQLKNSGLLPFPTPDAVGETFCSLISNPIVAVMQARHSHLDTDQHALLAFARDQLDAVMTFPIETR